MTNKSTIFVMTNILQWHMKKVIYNKYGSINNLKITEANVPIFNEKELLIKVKAVSINPLDWKKVEGELKIITGTKFPKGIAFDFAGIVEKKGNLISQYKIGDEVFGVLDAMKGEALAEYLIASEEMIYKKPSSISFETAAAMATVGTTALRLFEYSKANPGNMILINGASGGVGMITLQMAKRKGLKVTASATEQGLSFIRKWNPDNVIDYKKENVLQKKSNYDVIFELSGELPFSHAKSLMKTQSVYVTTLPNPYEIIKSFFNNIFSTKKHKTITSRPTQDNYRELCEWVTKGNLEISIAKIYSMKDFKIAYQFARQGGVVGKVVITI